MWVLFCQQPRAHTFSERIAYDKIYLSKRAIYREVFSSGIASMKLETERDVYLHKKLIQWVRTGRQSHCGYPRGDQREQEQQRGTAPTPATNGSPLTPRFYFPSPAFLLAREKKRLSNSGQSEQRVCQGASPASAALAHPLPAFFHH